MHGAVGEMEGSRKRSTDSTQTSKRRFLFFGMAALWGYVLGLGVLAAALSSADVRLSTDPMLGLWLAGGSALALGGGAVVAGAYREARRRHR
jgi:hypothetical protein